jgi:type II secretory pathway pseudopilin PulG
VRGPRGFALAAALLAIMLIGALLASLFFAITEETRTGAASRRRDHALAAAESAIQIGVGLLATQVDQSSIGTTRSQPVEVEGFPATVHITRLDSSLFWVLAVVGDSRDPAAVTRRTGLLVAASRDSSGSIRIVRIPERAWSELF